MDKDICEKCGGVNTYWREEHPDTGMDEMVKVCRDCEPDIKPLPWSFRMREKLSLWFQPIYGRLVIRPLFRLTRKSTKYTYGYCSWCGRQPGFSSSISHKGLRCTGCQKY